MWKTKKEIWWKWEQLLFMYLFVCWSGSGLVSQPTFWHFEATKTQVDNSNDGSVPFSVLGRMQPMNFLLWQNVSCVTGPLFGDELLMRQLLYSSFLCFFCSVVEWTLFFLFTQTSKSSCYIVSWMFWESDLTHEVKSNYCQTQWDIVSVDDCVTSVSRVAFCTFIHITWIIWARVFGSMSDLVSPAVSFSVSDAADIEYQKESALSQETWSGHPSG